MDREDILKIIAACSDFKNLDNILEEIGGGIDNNKFRGLWELSDILIKYTKVKNYDKILDIIDNMDLTTEEKYELLM